MPGAAEFPPLEFVAAPSVMESMLSRFCRAYSRMTAGSGSWPRVVRVMAAARISAPPTQA